MLSTVRVTFTTSRMPTFAAEAGMSSAAVALFSKRDRSP